jgi:hypothetical protein
VPHHSEDPLKIANLEVSWSRRFENPIPLPGGRTLRTLREAASHHGITGQNPAIG